MTMTIDSRKVHFDVETMADYAGIRQRFEEGFAAFVNSTTLAAARAVLRDELPQAETLVDNSDFVHLVAGRIDEEALLEKRYIFISVNPQQPAAADVDS